MYVVLIIASSLNEDLICILSSLLLLYTERENDLVTTTPELYSY